MWIKSGFPLGFPLEFRPQAPVDKIVETVDKTP